MLDRIKACFTESIQTQIAAAEALPDAISRAAMTLVQSLLNGNKILCCGNGTSAANAQHFAASMINRFETERPGLPAIALNTDNVVLTAIANDRLHDEIYAKQVRALGHARRCAAGDLYARKQSGHRQGGGSRRDPRHDHRRVNRL